MAFCREKNQKLLFKVDSVLLLLGKVAENLQQVIPNHLNSRDEQSLFRSMYIAKGRTEAYHIKVWIFLREATTLQTGANSFYQRLFAA